MIPMYNSAIMNVKLKNKGEIMNYTEAREYIKNASKKGSILGLDNIRVLMNKLHEVQDRQRIVHIAGTNGKGSVSAYLASILMETGMKVGRYNSPAVFDPLEVFRINDSNITKEKYAQLVSEVATAVEKMLQEGYESPTVFEIETAMAYLYFYKEKCDISIIETGMGGRDDATNVVDKPELEIITAVSMDHMAFLGDTLEEIATCKAGIIMDDTKVICAENPIEVKEVIKNEAKKRNASVIETGKYQAEYGVEKTVIKYTSFRGIEYNSLNTSMLGTFQSKNVVTAIEAAEVLIKLPIEELKKVVNKGIEKTRWQGRFEKINTNPLVYIDGGHNPGAALDIRKSIEIYFTNKKIVYIIGVLSDKDYDKVLELTGNLADYIITVTSPDNPRALDGKELLGHVLKFNENAEYAHTLEEAISKAFTIAGEDGVIFIYGSLSYLGKIKKLISCESRKK